LDTAVPQHERRRILVVDDDAASLDAVCELLTMSGHIPEKAADPQVALEALRLKAFDILLTDLALPGISGIELARSAVELSPDIKIIFASGNAMSERNDLGFEWTALHKPFPADALLSAIQATSGNRDKNR